MKTFKAKRDYKTFININLYLIPVIVLIFLITYFQNKPLLDATKASALTWGLCMSIIYLFAITTSYSLDEKYLRYKSGFVIGKIEISKISKLSVNQTMYVGLKPATSSKGIIIHYNKFDEIYISPQNNEEFVKELTNINPNINIERK